MKELWKNVSCLESLVWIADSP